MINPQKALMRKEIGKAIANFIRTKRNELGVTQETLAKRAGVCAPTLGRIESGNYLTTFFILYSIVAIGLDSSMEELDQYIQKDFLNE